MGTLGEAVRAALIQSKTRGMRKGPKMLSSEWTLGGRNVRRGMIT